MDFHIHKRDTVSEYLQVLKKIKGLYLFDLVENENPH